MQRITCLLVVSLLIGCGGGGGGGDATTGPPATVAAPTFDVPPGTFTSAQNVTISTATAGASIRYTTDGSIPTASVGTPYSSPVSVSSTATLRAIAFKSGMTDSAVASATYTITITGTVSAPTFSPVPGTFTSAQSVTISTATAGASIRYTTDGSIPTAIATPYSSPVSVSSTATLRAIAFKSGMTDSAVASATYTITITGTVSAPTFSPVPGTFTGAPTVTLSTTTLDASIRYTRDGTNPTSTTGTLYDSPFQIVDTTTIKAIAFKSGMTDSAVASATYTKISQVAAPIFDLPAGTYTGVQYLTITTTPGASIRLTSDGTNPTSTTGYLYTGPIPISVLGTHTVKAIAYKSGWVDSPITSRTYTFVITGPYFSPTPGTYTSGQNITISTITPTASIRYTTDGTNPSPLVGTLYTGPIPVTLWNQINAIVYVFNPGPNDYTIIRASATYTIGAYKITSIASGRFHNIALDNNGRVWRWGQNDVGQLGDNTYINKYQPNLVANPSEVSAVAAGYYHTAVLKNGGTVWSWGWNFSGQLGDGTTNDRDVPVQVVNLTGITAIAAGDRHTVALKNDGTVWAWGYNYSCQVDNTFVDQSTPVRSNNLTAVTAIAAGADYTVALKNDGTVWRWGIFVPYDAGNPGRDRQPVQVPNLTGVTAFAAGGYHTVALKNDGTVWSWGLNDYGQLGDATTTTRTQPVQAVTLTGVTAIAAGDYHTVALKNDGTVWMWGSPSGGVIGTNIVSQPTKVTELTGVTAIAGGYRSSLAIKSDDSVWSLNIVNGFFSPIQEFSMGSPAINHPLMLASRKADVGSGAYASELQNTKDVSNGGGCSISPGGRSKGESPLGTMLALFSPGILLIGRRVIRKMKIRI